MRVIGLMSGTSHDAIEVAAADLSFTREHEAAGDRGVLGGGGGGGGGGNREGPGGREGGRAPGGRGQEITAVLLGARTVELEPRLRAAVASILPPAASTAPAGVAERICQLDTWLGQAFAAAAELANRELCDGRADLVVSHGQTVHHWVDGGRALGTLQLGAPAWIAERTGVPVVSDLRTRDITRGGQGAPLVSLFDRLLLPPAAAPRAALNLGGIANLTVIPAAGGSDRGGGADGRVVAFDVGPANALIDAAVAALTGGAETMDTDGRRARRGQVLPALLEELLADPYYALPPPKSTGKEHFNGDYLARITARHPAAGRSGDDLVATLTELTAATVARACAAAGVAEVVASGGGTRNPALMAALARRVADRGPRGDGAEPVIRTIDALGIPSHAKEALAFALLGFLTAHGLPGTTPGGTGAKSPAVLGSITPGNRPLRLPEPVTAVPRRLRIGRAAG